MAAIIDPDELTHVQMQLGEPTPPVGMAAGAPQSGPILDPDELAHVQKQLEAAPIVAAPAATPAHDTSRGQVMEATPDRGVLGTIGDVGRMLTSQIPFADRFSAAMDTLVPGTGPGKSTDYAGNLRDERLQNEAIAAQHPILSKILGLAGGAAGIAATAPEAAIAPAASLAGRAIAGAGTGAAYGGIQGASEAPDLTNTGDVAKRAASGLGVGALAGAAMPLAAGLIGTGYSAAADALTGGAPGISMAASSRLLPAVAADTPQAIQDAAARFGEHGMLADAGPALLGKAQGAALNSDEGRSIMQSALAARDAGTNNRLAQDLNAAVGPAQSPQAATNAIAAQRTAVHQDLPQIFANAGPVDTSAVLANIGQRLNTARGPEAAVLSRARDYLMQDGVDAAGNAIRVPVTNPETLQNAKMAIDTLIDRGDPTLGVAPGAVAKSQGSIGDIRRSLNGVLRDQVPGYADVMDRSSALARGAEGIEMGDSVLNAGQGALRPDDLSAALQGMTPEQIAGLRVGARGAIDRTVGTKANDLVALRNAMQGEGGWNDAKLSSIFGAGPTAEIANSIDRNSAFRNTYQNVAQNSQTAQRQAAAAAMKPGAATGGIPLINPNMTLTGALATPVKAIGNALLNQLRPDPTRSYGEIARILSAQGPQRDAYTSALIDALARQGRNSATGAAVGNNAGLAAALIGGQYANDRLQRTQ